MHENFKLIPEVFGYMLGRFVWFNISNFNATAIHNLSSVESLSEIKPWIAIHNLIIKSQAAATREANLKAILLSFPTLWTTAYSLSTVFCNVGKPLVGLTETIFSTPSAPLEPLKIIEDDFEIITELTSSPGAQFRIVEKSDYAVNIRFQAEEVYAKIGIKYVGQTNVKTAKRTNIELTFNVEKADVAKWYSSLVEYDDTVSALTFDKPSQAGTKVLYAALQPGQDGLS